MKDKHQKFYYCEVCGNICGLIEDSGVPLYCCNEEMKCLKADESANKEKHTPDVYVDGKDIMVKLSHPMDDDHKIDWVYIETNRGGQRKKLVGSQEPTAVFCMAPNEEPVKAFAYCNKHGLWSVNI